MIQTVRRRRALLSPSPRFDREWDHCEEGCSARIRLDAELTTELLQARTHAQDSDAEPLRAVGCSAFGSAASIIANAENQTPSALPENKADPRGRCMMLNVGHGLLHDPQNGSL